MKVVSADSEICEFGHVELLSEATKWYYDIK